MIVALILLSLEGHGINDGISEAHYSLSYVSIQDKVKGVVKIGWVVGSQMWMFKHKAYWFIGHSPNMATENVLERHVVHI